MQNHSFWQSKLHISVQARRGRDGLVDTTKYLEVVMQSNLKFDSILHLKRIRLQKFWEQLNIFHIRPPEKASYWPTLVCAVPVRIYRVGFNIS